jgi:hypothetical protein
MKKRYDCKTLFSMTDEQRRRFEFPGTIGRKKKFVLKRPKLNRDELLEYLRKNQLDSEAKLVSFRPLLGPSRYDYHKEFGSWANAKKLAFGKQTFCDVTAEYLLKTVIRFGLYTIALYDAKRKEMPEVVPPTNHIYRKWGSFDKLKRVIRQYDIYQNICDYYQLWKKLGRKPTGGELQESRIYIDDTLARLGVDTLDEIVRGFLERDAKQNGNS